MVAHISQTQLSPVEFLQALLVEFGFKPFRKRKVELLAMLKDFLIEQYAAGKKLLLVIDEAQNLSRKVLEEVRLLSGLESQKEKLIRIIIAGQPELSRKLDSPRLQQLTQRVRLRFHLSALSKRETHEYITHRLNVAGANGRTIFTDAACDMVFRYAGGVPRLVNVLCDTALLCAFGEEQTQVDDETREGGRRRAGMGRILRTRPRARAARNDRAVLRRRRATRSRESRCCFATSSSPSSSLPFGAAIIGRTPENDLQIRSKFISRHHAQIMSDAEQSVLEDLNSTNGVYIKGKRVKHHELKDGDVIQLGEHKLLYRDLRRDARAGRRRRRRRWRTTTRTCATIRRRRIRGRRGRR